MSRRTIAIAAALSVLALGSPLMTANANTLADHLYSIGREKYEQGNYQGAIDDWSKAIEINPEFAAAYNNRGYAKYNLNDYQGAIADYDKAIENNPQDEIVYLNRGVAKYNLKDYKGAITDLDQYIEINPHHANPYYISGLARELANDLEGACDDWRKAADLGDVRSAERVKKQC